MKKKGSMPVHIEEHKVKIVEEKQKSSTNNV
jgi:hypothetical protein